MGQIENAYEEQTLEERRLQTFFEITDVLNERGFKLVTTKGESGEPEIVLEEVE